MIEWLLQWATYYLVHQENRTFYLVHQENRTLPISIETVSGSSFGRKSTPRV